MFCPKCGSQTADGARFCRACGQDVGLVHEAMTGHLPAVGASTSPAAPHDPTEVARRGKMLEGAIRHGSMGAAFAIISTLIVLFAPGGHAYGFWMLFPGLIMIGKGVSEYAHYRALGGLAGAAASRPALASPAATPRELSAPPTSFTDALPPPSVTEQTTRHLDRER